ncbi:MAG TPA: rod shape-determining protein MreC [Burkholderiales bacterium]|nr:rod shape-determining protein MreC [Burkholderiales bacterium]
MEHTPPPFFRRGPSLPARLAFFSLLSLVLLYADARFHYMEGMRRALAVILYPFQQLTDLPVEIGERVSEFFVTQSSLKRENERLRRENFVNGGLLQRQQALEAENGHLRALLDMRARVPRSVLTAEILYVARDPFTRQVVVDKGGSAGVQSGAPVIDDKGLVGQVHRVFPWLSEVSLITDREQTTPTEIVRNGLRAVVFGLGYDGALEVRFMPVNADIQTGDLLVTSGIDGVYPHGLPVAVVANIERNAAYPFAKITCTPASGVGSSQQVLVLSKGEPLPERPPAAEAGKRKKSKFRRPG